MTFICFLDKLIYLTATNSYTPFCRYPRGMLWYLKKYVTVVTRKPTQRSV